MSETVTIDIYTAGNVLTFDVLGAYQTIAEAVANALNGDTIILMLTDGGQLTLSGANVVAIEIKYPPSDK